MPSGYIIMSVDVTNPAQYEEYKLLSTEAMRVHGAEVCVRGGEVQVAPGEPAAWRQASFGVEQLGSLDVDLRLSQTAQSRARLEVYAQAAQQLDLDFTGTRVVLRFNDGRELVRLTDAAGRAIFEDVAEAELRSAVLEITPAERPPA